jgi:hypothetical protein
MAPMSRAPAVLPASIFMTPVASLRGVDEEEVQAEVERRLAVARRELEREFDAKRRQAKTQEGRMRDHLRKEEAEWAAYKAEQKKQLADQAETLRRQLESARKQTEAKERARAELDGAIEEATKWRAEEASLRRRHLDEVAALQSRLERANGSRRVAAFLLVAGAGALAVLTLTTTRTWWPYVVSAGLLGAAGLLWRRQRVVAPASAPPARRD